MAKLSLACATLVVGAALVTPFALARGAEEHHAEKPKPHVEEPAAKKGTATGEITKIDGGKVTLSENGKSETYWAHWHGGKPADGGGLDQKDVAAIAQCKVGDHVTIAWEFDEHRRIVSITKAK